MRKILIALLLLISHFSFSQDIPFPLLIGKRDTQVISCLDSINIANGRNYEIKRDVTNYGDLMLWCDYSIYDEQYYYCTFLILTFKKVGKNEICISQTMGGSTKHAYPNLSFIKENFQFVSDNKWMRPYVPNTPLKIIATFNVNEDNRSFCTIIYKLTENE